MCADFLDRPIDFPRDIDLTDEAGIRDAVRNNDGCIGCHAGLDPLAGYLAGFQYTDKTASEMVVYHSEREREWGAMTELAPGFYGAPGYSLRDLGRQIAAIRASSSAPSRPRSRCSSRRPVDWRDAREVDALTMHREAFLAGGLTLKSLIRSIVDDPRYRMAETPEGRRAKLVTPESGATCSRRGPAFASAATARTSSRPTRPACARWQAAAMGAGARAGEDADGDDGAGVGAHRRGRGAVAVDHAILPPDERAFLEMAI